MKEKEIPKETFRYLLKNALRGKVDKQRALGDIYRMGLGLPKDFKRAFHWYQRAAENGDIKSQANLGYCYLSGKGTEVDYSKALKLITNAAEQGNKEASLMLGYCYFYGVGIDEDKHKAVRFLRNAENRNSSNGLLYWMLGICSAEGYGGVKKDRAKAYEYFKKGAKFGYVEAQNILETFNQSELILK